MDATGSDGIPALVLDDGTAVTGEVAIRAYLDEHFAEPRGAEEQRAKAESIRRRECRETLAALDPTHDTRSHHDHARPRH